MLFFLLFEIGRTILTSPPKIKIRGRKDVVRKRFFESQGERREFEGFKKRRGMNRRERDRARHSFKEVTLARFSVKGSRTVRERASVLSGRNDRGRNFTTGSINIVVTRVAALSGRPGTVRSLDFNFNLKSLRPTRKDHLRSVRRSVSLEPERGEKRRIAAASSLGLFVRTRPTA